MCLPPLLTELKNDVNQNYLHTTPDLLLALISLDTLFLLNFSKLGLHLPHPVDSKNGKAQWDKSRELLTVTVRMVREYDFLTR